MVDIAAEISGRVLAEKAASGVPSAAERDAQVARVDALGLGAATTTSGDRSCRTLTTWTPSAGKPFALQTPTDACPAPSMARPAPAVTLKPPSKVVRRLDDSVAEIVGGASAGSAIAPSGGPCFRRGGRSGQDRSGTR